MVEVQGLSHAFEGRPVLKDIHLSVASGEILAVMGSSGGGKTTLLKCIAGLLKPTEGTVLIENQSIGDHLEQERGRIGMVFQYAALFDYMNVEENVLFGARRQQGLSATGASELLDYLLRVVRLDPEVRTKMPDELSGGMRKRVGLARALAMKPQVLLYDEPTSGLDPVTAFSIDRLIVETRNELGITSIVVSHDLVSVNRVADRLMFLSGGEAIYLGDLSGFSASSHPDIQEFLDSSSSEHFSDFE